MSAEASAAIDPVAEVASVDGDKPKVAKKARPSTKGTKKETTKVAKEPKAKAKTAKDSKEKVPKQDDDDEQDNKKGAAKRKPAGEKHPPFEEIIRECIAEAKEDVREGVSRPAIKSTFSLRPLIAQHA
jgi:hypothetical protein